MDYKELRTELTNIFEKNIPNIPKGMCIKNLTMSLEDISGEKFTISLEMFSDEYRVLEIINTKCNNKIFSKYHQ